MCRRICSFLPRIAVCFSLLLVVACAAGAGGNRITPTTAVPATPVRVHTPTRLPTPLPSPTSSLQPTPTPAESPSPEPTFVEHIIQPGDTLLGLGLAYDVPMAAIQLHNHMGDSTVVRAGQTLSIPPRVGWEGASPFWVVYVVQPGDTLVDIAHTYGLDASMLQAANGLADADLLGIDQELILPLDAPAVAQAPPPTATPIPLPLPAVTPATEALVASPPSPTTAPPADVAEWPYETVRLINQVRAQHGLGPLAYNETLARAAQVQADDCARRGWCSHTGSDGSDIKTRILRAGYEPASWAECWAQRQTPQGAVDIWMDEVPPNDPHRRTLLTTWLSEIGVGVAQTDWGYYFIADFGRP